MEDVQNTLDIIKKEQDFFKKARLLEFLKNEKKMRIKDLSSSLELKQSYVCHILRLNKLPPIIVDGYYSKLVSISHLFILARLKNEADMVKAYEQVLTESLTALQTDELVRSILYNVATEGEKLPQYELREFNDRLSILFKHLQLKVVQTRVRGRLILEVRGGYKTTTPVLKKVMQRLFEGSSASESRDISEI